MAGSNNFIQHNPTEANQEDTAAFIANSLTSGGVGLDAILPHDWLNKRWYQDSTMVAAIGMMMAAKGYVISDSDINVLAATLAHLVTDADLKTPLVSVPYSPTPTFDATNTNGFDILLAGNVTSSTLANVAIGQIITFIVTQPIAGGLTFVPPVIVNGWQPVNTAPNAVTVQRFIRDINGDIQPLVVPPTISKATFTSPGGDLFSGTQITYDTGIAVSSTTVATGSVQFGTINPILTYMVTTQGGTVKIVVSNTSSSHIFYGSLNWTLALL